MWSILAIKWKSKLKTVILSSLVSPFSRVYSWSLSHKKKNNPDDREEKKTETKLHFNIFYLEHHIILLTSLRSKRFRASSSRE